MPQTELARAETATRPQREHCLTMNGRHDLTLTGIERILAYDETGATLVTPLGNLTVGGQGLEVSELSVHTGQVHISGHIDSLQYTENRESGGGFLARLLR